MPRTGGALRRAGAIHPPPQPSPAGGERDSPPCTEALVMEGKQGQGIGARVLRKEDARHLHGRGNFVSDMVLPGQSEVAFLRSPVAHARLTRIVKPAGL